MKLPHVTRRMTATAALLAAALVIGATAALWSAATGAGAQQLARIEPTPVPPAPRAHKDLAPVEHPLTTLLRSATVLAPHTYENLTLFPVTVSYVADFGPALTMDEALNRGLLLVQEVGYGDVNRVMAINRSDRYVFMMASEMIGGAKQDRTLGEDVLLAPHDKVEIPVFCVEASRWTPGAPSASFRAMEQAAGPSVRSAARARASQSDVWAEVGRAQERAAAPSAGKSLRSVYESEHVQRKMAPYVAKLDDVPSAAPNVIGVVVARSHRIVAADLFCKPDLFRRLWPKLLRSYAADAIGDRQMGGRVSAGEAERFLGRLYNARRDQQDTPGAGYLVRLQGSGVSGSALIFKRAVVHLEVFPGVELLRPDMAPAPEPERPMNLQYRRERLERGAR